MTTFECILFIAYLCIQIILPLRRQIRAYILHFGRGDVMADYGDYFSWGLFNCVKMGRVTFTISEPGGNPLYKICVTTNSSWKFGEMKFSSQQVGHFVVRPNVMIQVAHYLEDYLRKQGFEDELCIFINSKIDINFRGLKRYVDPYTDVCKEKIKKCGFYSWYYEKGFVYRS